MFNPEQIPLELREILAAKVHDTYVQGRLQEGWTYGPERNDELKTNPTLIPYSELPESEKEYDRRTAEITLKTIAEAGYHIEKPDRPIPSAEIESLLEVVSSQSLPQLSLLRRLWVHRAESCLSEKIFTALASQALELGELPLVVDVAKTGLEKFPDNFKLTQVLALAHLQEGHLAEAQEVLSRILDEDNLPSLSPFKRREALAAGGRLYKEAWQLHGNERDLKLAIQFYHRAFKEGDQDSYPLINEATLTLVGGNTIEEAHRLARQVLALTHNQSDRWTLATRAEAFLILGQSQEALATYREALQGDFSWREAARIRQQARWICSHALGDAHAMDPAFSGIPKIVIYSGHRLDSPDRSTPRFPASEIPRVQKELTQKLAELQTPILYGSGSSGADLLVLEAAPDHVERNLVLPSPPESFQNHSVAPDWHSRFEAQLARLEKAPTILNRHHPASSSQIYAYTNEIIIGLASLRAKKLALDIEALVVWDGKPSEGIGGTGHFVQLCQEHLIPLNLISPCKANSTSEQQPTHKPSPKPARQVIRALLMADVFGFSSLDEDQALEFQKHFMGEVATVIRSQDHPPLTSNTWGDALYLTFQSVAQAAQFSLTLQRCLQEKDWSQLGLPEQLSFRIALHAGPVFALDDPITGTPTFHWQSCHPHRPHGATR